MSLSDISQNQENNILTLSELFCRMVSWEGVHDHARPRHYRTRCKTRVEGAPRACMLEGLPPQTRCVALF